MSNINPVTEASVEATPLPPQPAVTNPVGTAAPILPVAVSYTHLTLPTKA